MGLALSILYLLTYYLTPVTLFGPLAAYRIELILAVLALLVSFPALTGRSKPPIAQSLAVFGMAIAVLLSVLVGADWPGGAVNAFFEFIPNAFAFFLVCLHCNTRKRLQVLVAMLLFVCVFVIANGYHAELKGFSPAVAHLPGFEGSPYLLAMQNSTGAWFYRLRGLGEIHDPNDFAQLIVAVIPLAFIFWRPKQRLSNTILVLVPVGILIFGTFLTHSRGSLLALLAVLIVAIRPRLGSLPSAFLAGGLFVAAQALNFGGGRDISVDAGAGRTDLWGLGLDVFKGHPLFGIGFQRLPEYIGLTAHNSIVVCAAELGLLGLFFWCLFLLPITRDAILLASPEKVNEAAPPLPEETPYRNIMPGQEPEVLERSEIVRLGRIMLLSLTGYFVAAWFLSRAYVVTLFMLGGMVEVIYSIALRNGMVAPRLKLPKAVLQAGGLSICCILTIYIMLRVVHFT